MNPVSLEFDPNINDDSVAIATAIGPEKLLHYHAYPISFEKTQSVLVLAMSDQLTKSESQKNAEAIGRAARALKVRLREVTEPQMRHYEAHLKELGRNLEAKRNVITEADRIRAAEMRFDETTMRLASRLITEEIAYRFDVVGLNYNREQQALLIGSEDDGPALREEIKKSSRVPNLYIRKMPVREVRDLVRKIYVRAATTEKSDIKRLIDEIVSEALRRHSADIALEYDDADQVGRVRFAIDNNFEVSHKYPILDKEIYRRLVAVIREAGRVTPPDQNECGDGKLQLNIEGRDVSLRINTIPYRGGGEQRVSMRVLSNMLQLRRFEDLGISPHVLRQFRRGMARPGAFNVIAGPVGEGKTTTAYTLLNTFVNLEKKNVMSIEQPIEYPIPGINQIQIASDPDAETDPFAKLLKAMVRQYPQFIFLGEIREQATAHEAMRAATSGISLLSTTHAPDAPQVLSRLKAYGVSRFDMAQNLTMAASQRLLSRLCDNCKEKTNTLSHEAMRLAQTFQVEIISGSVMRARKNGCKSCDGTGYRDRVAAFEVLEVNAIVAEAIESESMGTVAVAQLAVQHGYRPMAVAALEHLVNGLTSEDAILEKLNFADAQRYVSSTTKVVSFVDPEEQIRIESESGRRPNLLDNVA